MAVSIPRIYPILDASTIPRVGRAEFLTRLSESLADAGVTLLEYRNKIGTDGELIADAEILRRNLRAAKLVLDDRADLVERVGFDGVHVDSGDITPTEARRMMGPQRIVGTFGGSEELVKSVLLAPADYFSIGPIYPTGTKQTTKTPIGIDGIGRLRWQAGLGPVLVAVGGITLDTAPAVLVAGASTVAISAALFRHKNPANEFRRWVSEIGA